MSRSERVDERRLRAYSRGLDAAQKAIHATADGEDGRALAILNAQDRETAVATSAVLLGCLRSVADALADGDPAETRRRLHAGADGITDDGPVTEAEVIIAQAFNRLTGA